jgi:phosphoglycerate kinase
MMQLISLRDLDIAGKRIFIRCDFNVPLDEFKNITDDRRIKSAMATINYCLDQDCSIILATHLGRPNGKVNKEFSLIPIQKRLHHLLKQDVILASDVVGDDAKSKVKALKEGEILLLENLRFEIGEEKNDKQLSKTLASFADIYVNDAFGVSHRAHASVEGMSHFFNNNNKSAGFLLQKEIQFFDKTLSEPSRPFAAIIGGSKVSGKLQALTNLLPKVDKILIGGGMAFTFLKAMGEEVGNSLVEDDLIDEALNVMKEAKRLGVKFYLPVDVVAAEKFEANATSKLVTSKEIPKDWMGLDIGPATVRLFRQALNNVQTVLWNGPMGVYEMDRFSRGSSKIAHFVADSYATTIVGGGDTADLIQRIGLDEEMTFISTGGGASLELLEGKILPGVQALAL